MENYFKSVGVIGSGQMGAGIAQVIACKGIKAKLYDTDASKCEKAISGIHQSVQKLIQKKLLENETETLVKNNLASVASLNDLKDCDLIIEAIVENEAVKTDLFKKLDEIVKPDAIFASNTSSIPITRLGAVTQRSPQVIGMHFMNPVPIMKLVEIIPGMNTSEEVATKIKELAKFLGKEISYSKDYPGFVVNRILMPMINEAFYALMEGVASAKDIDTGMKLGTNQPMGPLTLADFIGLDTCLSILRVLHEGLGDPKYRPCPLLCKYVEAGKLGRKTKSGVYEY